MQAGVVAPTVAHLLSSNLKISLLAIITLTTLTQIHGARPLLPSIPQRLACPCC